MDLDRISYVFLLQKKKKQGDKLLKNALPVFLKHWPITPLKGCIMIYLSSPLLVDIKFPIS